MPNTPSLVQHGATVYSLGSHATSTDAEIVESIFSGVGECFRVNVSPFLNKLARFVPLKKIDTVSKAISSQQESMIDAVTGISGSGPAYMYLIIGEIFETCQGLRSKILGCHLVLCGWQSRLET